MAGRLWKWSADSVYALILMDVQMPEMDGLEATRRIRSMAAYEHLPILAMTGNTSSKDLRACLEAGMNDTLTKPVTPENLFTMINKWLPEPGQPGSKEATSPAVLPGGEVVDDAALQSRLEAIEGLDTRMGLRNMSGDASAYLRLLCQLDVTFMEDLKRLHESLGKGENTQAGNVAHTLKGVAGTLGLVRVQELALALEEKSHNQANEEAAKLVEALTAELKNLQDALNSLVR